MEILKYGSKVLSTPSAPVTEFDGAFQDLVKRMIETMYAAPGVGLAAPQVGVALRLAVIDPSVGEDPAKLIVIANPEIKATEGEQVKEEGCLSVPGFYAEVVRPSRAFVTALDQNGNPVEYEGTDLVARAFCHEMDHLNGKFFLDHLSPIKRELMRRKIRKMMQAGEW
ncbi:MAG: peptide deformylase [Acidobacteriota bacterium]